MRGAGVSSEAVLRSRRLDVAGIAAIFKEAGVGRERIAEVEENGKLLDNGVCLSNKLASNVVKKSCALRVKLPNLKSS